MINHEVVKVHSLEEGELASGNPSHVNCRLVVTNLETKIKMTKLVGLSLDEELNYSPMDEDLASCQVSREKWVEMNEVSLHLNCVSSSVLKRIYIGHPQVLGP